MSDEGNLGNTEDYAGGESRDRKDEVVSKEASPCSASSIAPPLASNKGRKRKNKLKDGLSDFVVAVRRSNRCHGQARGSRNKNSTNTTRREKLDSKNFLRFLMHLWDAFPEDKMTSVTYFDPLWFGMYANGNRDRKDTVLSWIKKKDIFSKKYVFVPIVMWSHWSLLIFCNLGGSLDSKTNVPCMLLLDSLHATGSRDLLTPIRRLLTGIYKSADRPESEKQLSKMLLSIPEVPQQKNGEECGFYVLYYIHLFVKRAPETFNISKRYPNLMGKKWFTDEEVESFRKALDALPADVSDHDPASSDSSDSIEMAMTPFL